jgi:DsbC/DsbD-like thiol-disulfide interchange protein
MRSFLAAGLLLASVGSAIAGATPWQDVAPGARLRLISSDVRDADGTTLVGLELDMPQSFRTYWRLPGETGIPTQFDLAGSVGVDGAIIQWPYPTPEVTQGLLDYVYHGETVLPIELKTTAGAPLLEVAVVMGVCSEVCVPVEARFALPLSFAHADAGQSIRLRQAEALAPIPWNLAGSPFGGVSYDAAHHALELAATNPAIDPASIIASTGDPAVIFDAPQKSPDGRSLLLPLRGQDSPSDWVGNPVDFTFMTSMGAFTVSERVATRP